MRLLTREQRAGMSDQQAAVRRAQLGNLVHRLATQHRQRYHGPLSATYRIDEYQRCLELQRHLEQPRDALGRFARRAS